MSVRTTLTTLALASAALASTAGPAMASTHSTQWWDDQTIAAYHAYEHHQTPCRFAIMARDATHADTYLRVDIGQWARDRARHAPAATLRTDAWYVWLDVTQPAD